MVLGQKLT